MSALSCLKDIKIHVNIYEAFHNEIQQNFLFATLELYIKNHILALKIKPKTLERHFDKRKLRSLSVEMSKFSQKNARHVVLISFYDICVISPFEWSNIC